MINLKKSPPSECILINSTIQNPFRKIVAPLSFAILFLSVSGCAIDKSHSSVTVHSAYKGPTTIRIELPTNKISFDVHGTSRFFYESDTYILHIPKDIDDASGDEIDLRMEFTETKLAVGSNSKVQIVGGKTSCVVEIALFNQKNKPYPVNGTYKADRCYR